MEKKALKCPLVNLQRLVFLFYSCNKNAVDEGLMEEMFVHSWSADQKDWLLDDRNLHWWGEQLFFFFLRRMSYEEIPRETHRLKNTIVQDS